MLLEDKIPQIQSALAKEGISVNIDILYNGWFNPHPYAFSLKVGSILDDEDIETGALIERVLRQQAGYGSTKKEYDCETKCLTMVYEPYQEETRRIVSSGKTYEPHERNFLQPNNNNCWNDECKDVNKNSL